MKSRTIFILIATSIILISFSYLFIDRSVVWFLVEHHSRQFGVLKLFANTITLILSILIFLFVTVQTPR
jgi:hypothetical protein